MKEQQKRLCGPEKLSRRCLLSKSISHISGTEFRGGLLGINDRYQRIGDIRRHIESALGVGIIKW